MTASMYRLALHLLPTKLRTKHGASMEVLYRRELDRAREKGAVQVVITSARGFSDILARSIYELQRSAGLTISDFNTANRGTDSLSQLRPSVLHTQGENRPMANPHSELPRSRELLRQLAVTFAAALFLLTSVLLYVFSSRQLSQLSASGDILSGLLLALPFTAAMTIPMAVFVAVIVVFARLGKNGTLDIARRHPHGARSLAKPTILAATVVAVFAFVVTAEVVPRTNARLQNLLVGRTVPQSDRSMTITELRAAARQVGPATDPNKQSRVAAFEIEVQKKIALPAASIVLALAAIAIAFGLPKGGMLLAGVSSIAVFGAYYMLVMIGETLADSLVVSPVVGMWWANALILALASIAAWRQMRSSRRGLDAIVARN